MKDLQIQGLPSGSGFLRPIRLVLTDNNIL